MLRVEGLVRHFGSTKAVDDLSFGLPKGKVLGLIGPNGAGKTTTIQCILGLLRYQEGHVWVDGMPFEGDQARACRALMGHVPEVPEVPEYLTVWELLTFGARAWGITEGWEPRAEDLISKLDLGEKRDEKLSTLSKGQKQKAAVAATFLHEPRLVLMDEPLVGIDPRGGRVLKDLIAETVVARGGSVLISSHILALVEEVCDEVLILHEGRKLAHGSVEELARQRALGEDSDLEDVFLEITKEA